MTERLPIYHIERDIVEQLASARRLVLQAPTGSGKSTQVPQMLLKHGLLGNGQCVVLQPRRLAARMLAARVASELGVPNNTISRYLTKKVGSKFEQGDTIARTRRGLRTVSFPAPAAGTLTSVDESNGTAVFSLSSGQNQLRALVSGEVQES